MQLIKALIYILISLTGPCAFAEPQLWGTKRGSLFEILANNSEARPYTCSVYYELSYQQHGELNRYTNTVSFVVPANVKSVAVHSFPTPWAASTLDLVGFEKRFCNQGASASGPTLPPPFQCPAGLRYIGEGYGEKDPGHGNFLYNVKIKFPRDFFLDDSAPIAKSVRVTGGGASSPWDGKNIPNGIWMHVDGGHYWAVGVPVPGAGDGKPKVTISSDGKATLFTLGMYCGPAGFPGPGCNVKVNVCAKPR